METIEQRIKEATERIAEFIRCGEQYKAQEEYRTVYLPLMDEREVIYG